MKYYWNYTIAGQEIVLTNSLAEVLGGCVRQKDGGWLCFVKDVCVGKEPSAEYAQKTVEQCAALDSAIKPPSK